MSRGKNELVTKQMIPIINICTFARHDVENYLSILVFFLNNNNNNNNNTNTNTNTNTNDVISLEIGRLLACISIIFKLTKKKSKL